MICWWCFYFAHPLRTDRHEPILVRFRSSTDRPGSEPAGRQREVVIGRESFRWWMFRDGVFLVVALVCPTTGIAVVGGGVSSYTATLTCTVHRAAVASSATTAVMLPEHKHTNISALLLLSLPNHGLFGSVTELHVWPVRFESAKETVQIRCCTKIRPSERGNK